MLNRERILDRDALFLIFIFVLSLLIYRLTILSPGTVARIDLDQAIPYSFPHWADYWLAQNVYSWWQVDGGFQFSNPAFLPVPILAKLASLILNLTASQFEQLLLVIFTALSGWSSYFMIKDLAFNKARPLSTRHRLASLIAALAYMFSPWVFDLELYADPYMFAYALAPLAFLYIAKMIDSAPKLNKRNVILAALAFSAVTALALPVAFMLFFAAMLYFIFEFALKLRRSTAKRASVLGLIKIGATFLITWLALNGYWIIQQSSPTAIASFTGTTSVDDVYTTSFACYLYNVFRLQGSPYGYFAEATKALTNPVTILLSFVFPILCFSALIIKPKEEKVQFFSILAAISIAFGAGILGPLGSSYVWLFLHIPYFDAFRVSYKFVFLTSLAYTFLVAVVAEYLINIGSSKVAGPADRAVHHSISGSDTATVNVTFQKIGHMRVCRAIKYTILILLLVSLSLNAVPMLTGNMSGYLPSFEIPSEYHSVYDMLAAQPGFFRILLLPMSTPIQPDWLPANVPYIHNPFDINPPNHPVICNDVATPTMTALTKFLQNTILENDTYDFNGVLALLSVQYIVVTKNNLIGEQLPSPDTVAWEFVAYGWPGYYIPQERIMSFLTTDAELSMKHDGADLSVFEYNNPIAPHVYATSASSLAVGGGYGTLTNMSQSTVGLFAAQYDANYLLTNHDLFSRVVFYDANVADLALSTMDSSYTFQPYDYAYHGYRFSQYWVQSNYFPVTYAPYTTGVPLDGKFAAALASNVNMSIPFSARTNSSYEVWASILFDSNLGTLKFTLGNQHDTVNTSSTTPSLKWTPIFTSVDLPNGEYQLEISNIKGDNAINSVVIVPSTVLNELENQYSEILKGNQVTYVQSSEKPQNPVSDGLNTGNFAAEGVTLTCEQINPTKYTIEVNASKAYFLIFSESYDTGWTASINGQQIPEGQHFMADGFANGWYVNKTGAYSITLEFSPQNLFYAGAVISIVALIVCVILVCQDVLKIRGRKIQKKQT